MIKITVLLSVFLLAADAGYAFETEGLSELYVSISDGDDATGTGSVDQPFKTIAKAMAESTSGGTCVIREGVYRETIVPEVDNLTIMAYEGEDVVITGCDQLTSGWGDAAHDANIKTNATDVRVMQVFIDEDRMNLARFPNEDENMLNKSDMVGTVTLGGTNVGTGFAQVRFDSDAGLPDDGDDTWVGGSYCGLNGDNIFTAAIGEISASSGRLLSCTNLSFYWRTNPEAISQVGDGKGYVINHLRALDVETEWYSADDGTFYLYPPSDVDLSVTPVDVRTRLWGADLSERSEITLEGLHFFASSVLMSNSLNCVMRECHVEYPAPWSNHYFGVPGDGFGASVDAGTGGQDYGGPDDGSSGVFLSGTSNRVENCWIEKSWGSGVRLEGTDNGVYGSLIEDCDWMMRRYQPVQAFGLRSQVISNTVRRCAQSAIDGGNRLLGGTISEQITVKHNVIEKPALLLHDTGAFYINHQGLSSNGTEFSYNVIKDNTSNLPYGFYGDNGTDDMFIHHNLLIIPDAWIGIRFNGSRNAVFNNTVMDPDEAIIHQRSGNEGQRVINNLGNKKIKNDGDYAEVSNNITSVSDSRFVDVDTGDYRINSTDDQAVDGGIELSPYTDGFSGDAPDIGCYETGQPIWNAGSWVNAEISATEGTLLSSNPLDPIEVNAGTDGAFADFSITEGMMGVIPVTLHNVPASAHPVVTRYLNGEWSHFSGVEGTEQGAEDYAYVTTDNGDGTVDYRYTIQRATTLLSSEWRIRIAENEPPTADSQSLATPLDNTLSIPLSGNDPEGASLSYILQSDPANGELSGTAPDLTYTPDDGFSGSDSFTFAVSDGLTNSGPATIWINVSSTAAQSIEYNFGTAGYITGATSSIVYTAPDLNTFGAGVTAGNVELSDGSEDTDYGRFTTMGGGSVEAAINDRAAGNNTIEFTLTISDAVRVSFSSISFDTFYYTSATGTTEFEWVFETIVGSATNTAATGGFSHDGGTNYQSPASASGDIALTGLTDLSGTAVTFRWSLDGVGKSHNFATRSMGLDDLLLIGALSDLGQSISGFEGAAMPGGTNMVLSWQAEAGQVYSVMTTTNLMTGPWTNLVAGVQGVDGLLSVTNTYAEDQQFFRVYTSE